VSIGGLESQKNLWFFLNPKRVLRSTVGTSVVPGSFFGTLDGTEELDRSIASSCDRLLQASTPGPCPCPFGKHRQRERVAACFGYCWQLRERQCPRPRGCPANFFLFWGLDSLKNNRGKHWITTVTMHNVAQVAMHNVAQVAMHNVAQVATHMAALMPLVYHMSTCGLGGSIGTLPRLHLRTVTLVHFLWQIHVRVVCKLSTIHCSVYMTAPCT
jgi:hypothetical protein